MNGEIDSSAHPPGNDRASFAETNSSVMRQEIGEQPEALRRTIAEMTPRVREIQQLWGRAGRSVIFLARGSSANAACYGRYLAEVAAGVPCEIGSPAVATLYNARMNLDGVLVVAVSQSGQTAELVTSMQWARNCGAATLAITNVPDSPLAQAADLALATKAGPERAVPATKTFTTQLAALVVMAAGVGARLDLTELARMPDELEQLLSRDRHDTASAATLAAARAVVVSGRGFTTPIAREIALKIQEASYVPAIGISSADLQHGPIAMLAPEVPLLLLSPRSGPTVTASVELAHRADNAAAPVIGIGGDAQFAAACTSHIDAGQLPEWLAPFALTLMGQLLVERLATNLGHNPDRPRGLKKITQTD